ncbi:DnaA/Hda family protein [Candidatus Pelagibacter sp.]|nr:DnaA/Hda family protein [Candidatus Pelagibacter sp.]
MSIKEQQLIDFNFDKNYKSDDFFVSKCNYFAFNLLDSWPKWEKNILNVHGEKYSGKSHLSEIFIKKNKGLILNPEKLKINYEKDLRFYENIILDDFNEQIDEKIIFSLINFVDQNSKYLIINSISPFNKMNFNLKDLGSRAKNCLEAKIEKPDDELTKVLIFKHLSDKQIKIDNKLVEFAAKRITRSYSKISEFIYKIDEISLKKKKSIDQKTIKEALGEKFV